MTASRARRPIALLLLLASGCSSTLRIPQEDISPDGTLFATSEGRDVKLTRISDDRLVRTLSSPAEIVALHFSVDGDRLVSGDRNGRISVWNPNDGICLLVLAGHRGAIEQFAVRKAVPDLASASDDGTIRLWDLHGGKELRTLHGHQDAVYSVEFSPDGKLLASASKDRTVKLWDAATGAELLTYSGHAEAVRAVAFDATGSRLATGGDDGVIKVWDVKAGSALRSIQGSKGPIRNLFISQDGRHLLAYQSGQDRALSIWDLRTGEAVVEDYFFEVQVAPRNWPYRAVFEDVAKRAAHRQ